MTRRKRIALLAAGSLAGVIILLLAAALLAPRFVDSEALTRRIVEEVGRKGNIQLEFSGVRIQVLPWPALVVTNGQFARPGRFSGTFDSLTVEPEILPLFAGSTRVAQVQVTAPKVHVVPNESEAAQENDGSASGPPSLQSLASRVPDLLRALQGKFPRLGIEVTRGELELSSSAGAGLHLFDLNGTVILPPDAEFRLSAASNHFQELTLEGWANPDHGRGSANLVVKGLDTGDLPPLAIPGLDMAFDVSRLDCEIAITMDGTSAFKGSIRARSPLLTSQVSPERHVPLRDLRLNATGTIDGGALSVHLGELRLSEPRLTVSGNVTRTETDPAVLINLEARDFDVAEARLTALALAPRSRAVRKVFQIVQEGHVPVLAYRAKAESLRDLGKFENFVITGSMKGGRIAIPRAPLLIDEAAGDVRIADGILEGTELQGRTGDSRGHNGSLRVGLTGGDAPFHLEIDIDADLKDLPPVLHHFVKDEHFLGELDRVEHLQGNALGRLTLGESLKAVKTKVETRRFSLSTRYRRLPTPVTLGGDSFLYEGTRVEVKGLAARTETSEINGATLAVDWGEDRFITMESKNPAHFDLNELYGWLSGLESLKSNLRGVAELKGNVAVDGFAFHIPFRALQDARLHASGTLSDVSFKSPVLKETTTFHDGRFEMEGDRVFLRDVNGAVLDGSFRLSGEILHPVQNGEISNLAVSGNFGAQSVGLMTNLLRLPADLRPKSPVTLVRGDISVNTESGFSFAGELSVKNGPKCTLDVQQVPGQLSIRNLAIADKASDATLSLNIRPKQIQFAFDGTLANSTMDALLESNRILSGSIKGKLNGKLMTDNPAASTATGQLQLTGFNYLWGIHSPAHIATATLLAKGNRVEIQKSTLQWQDGPASLSGSVEFSPSAFKVDLDFSTDLLDWDWIRPEEGASGDTARKPAGPKDAPSDDALKFHVEGTPLQGTIRVRTRTFLYGGRAFAPMNANVQLRPDGLRVQFEKAVLCGIPTAGFVDISRAETRIEASPSATDADLAQTLLCLWHKEHMLDGTYTLKGTLTTHGKKEELIRNLNGDFEFSATKGRIYRFSVLAKIFASLNVSGLIRGKLPDLANEGCPYDSIRGKATIRDGKIQVEDTVMDADCAKMALSGTIDLVENKVNLTALVSPLKTVDKIIDKVPVLRSLLDGTLVTVPVGVRGDLSDPSIVPLSPSAIGSELLGFMKRTFQLPLKLVHPPKK